MVISRYLASVRSSILNSWWRSHLFTRAHEVQDWVEEPSIRGLDWQSYFPKPVVRCNISLLWGSGDTSGSGILRERDPTANHTTTGSQESGLSEIKIDLVAARLEILRESVIELGRQNTKEFVGLYTNIWLTALALTVMGPLAIVGRFRCINCKEESCMECLILTDNGHNCAQ